jgi:hypothetical protein
MSNNQQQFTESKAKYHNVTIKSLETTMISTSLNNDDSSSNDRNSSNIVEAKQQQQDDPINNNNQHNIIIGKTRIQDTVGGYIGTIVYVGTVASASKKNVNTQYCGIIWDDISRGIHDGSVICRCTNKIVRHFYTYPIGTTSGSFIKLSLINFGLVLTPSIAVNEKYIPINSIECLAPNNIFPNHTACTTSGKNNKPIEFYGEYKIRQYQQISDLPAISLRRYGLYDFNSVADWSNFIHIQELDLAGNLFSSWDPILTILQSFPNLIKLSIACNRVGDIIHDDNNINQQQQQNSNSLNTTALGIFPNLLHFNLNETYIRTLSTLLFIGRIVPNLQELIIANNNSNVSNNSTTTGSSKIAFTANSSTTTIQNDILVTSTTSTTSGSTTATTYDDGECETTSRDITTNAAVKQQQEQNIVHDFATTFSNLLYLDVSNCCSSTTNDNDNTMDDWYKYTNENNDWTSNKESSVTTTTTATTNRSQHDQQQQVDSLFQSTIQMITLWSQLPKLQFVNFDNNPIQNLNVPLNVNSCFDKTINDSDQTMVESITPGTSTTDTRVIHGSCNTTKFYPNVQHIQLCGTLINDWSQIDVLHTMIPSIRSLRFRNCPLLQGGGGSNNKKTTTGHYFSNDNANRCLIISHVPYLHTLNGTIITEMEQREAARWCVRTYNTKKLLQQQQQQQQCDVPNTTTSTTSTVAMTDKKDHPQYDYWITKYPEMIGRISTSTTTTSSSTERVLLSDSIINVTIRSMIPSSCTMEPILRRLPYHLTIGRLKALCSRQFGPIDIDLIELTYRIGQNTITTTTGTSSTSSSNNMNWSLPICIENTNDTITLEQIGIPVDGAEILVHEINIHDLNQQHEQKQQKKYNDEQEFINVLQQKELHAINFQRRQQHG